MKAQMQLSTVRLNVTAVMIMLASHYSSIIWNLNYILIIMLCNRDNPLY